MTRRQFLRFVVSTASLTTAACTAPSGVRTPILLGNAPVRLWSTTYAVDGAIARWRGQNPRIPVSRQVYDPATLRTKLTAVVANGEPGPDLVIADADTVGAVHETPFWRRLDRAADPAAHAANGIAQCVDDQGTAYAIPLCVNPIGIWYDRAIFATGIDDTSPAALTALFGASMLEFVAGCTRASHTVATAPLLSSALDDIAVPLLLDNRQNSAAVDTAVVIATAQAAIAARLAAPNQQLDGSWFQHLTHQRSGVIVGGRWVHGALQRALGEGESSWRLTQLTTGGLAAPGLVAAIPALAAQADTAEQIARAFSDDVDLQLRIAAASQTIPSRLEAHADGVFQGADVLCGGQEIGALWCTLASALPPVRESAQARIIALAQRKMVRDGVLPPRE